MAQNCPHLPHIAPYFNLPWPILPTRSNLCGSKWSVHVSRILHYMFLVQPAPHGGILGPKSQFWQKFPFLAVFGDFSSLSVRALLVPERKIWDHFSIQIYPLLVGNMASETTFGHWKVVFSWGKGRKMTFSQKPLNSRFWASGFWMSILSSANFKKDPPWNIFSLSVHAPATSGYTEIYILFSLVLSLYLLFDFLIQFISNSWNQ